MFTLSTYFLLHFRQFKQFPVHDFELGHSGSWPFSCTHFMKKELRCLRNVMFKTFWSTFSKDSHFGGCKLGCVPKVPFLLDASTYIMETETPVYARIANW